SLCGPPSGAGALPIREPMPPEGTICPFILFYNGFLHVCINEVSDSPCAVLPAELVPYLFGSQCRPKGLSAPSFYIINGFFLMSLWLWMGVALVFCIAVVVGLQKKY
ncbi:MAG: hypothetical protein IIW11_00945, partial [Bacteroidales bacterium]|nr:hypothetical protein [Bacteroidales bacterium]